MEESGESFIEGTPEEVANLLGCSMEVLRRCVGELKRTKAAEVVAETNYVKIVSRRLLKKLNLREYNRLKQQERRGQSSVNVVSIECQDPKSFRDTDTLSSDEDRGSPGGDADQPCESACLPADEKPARKPTARKSDPRKDHPAIVCVLKAAKRYPPKDLWDETIAALGDSPDVEFFARSYTAWRKFGGSPTNYERWLFEPAKTGNIPERYENGQIQKHRSGNGNGQNIRAERAVDKHNRIEQLRARVEAEDREVSGSHAPDRA
jgi:hypothetical protein